MNFHKKNILITGASSGIGKALAAKLAHIDCNIIICARRIEKLEALKEELSADAADIFPIKCDVTDKNSVAEAFGKIKTELGDIDAAILNSGVGFTVEPENFNSDAAEKIYRTNVLGVIYCIEELLPDMMKRKEGIIAGISSLADNRGFSGSGFYCSSKAALTIFLEGLRIEMKNFGVKVITVKPGFVKTPMTDRNKFAMPFIMPAEKAAEIILRGLKKEKRIIQFPFLTAAVSRLIGFLPTSVFEFLSEFIK